MKRSIKPRDMLGEQIVSWSKDADGYSLRTIVGSWLKAKPGEWRLSGFGRFNNQLKILTGRHNVRLYHKVITLWLSFRDEGMPYDFVLGRPHSRYDEFRQWALELESLNADRRILPVAVKNKRPRKR